MAYVITVLRSYILNIYVLDKVNTNTMRMA